MARPLVLHAASTLMREGNHSVHVGITGQALLFKISCYIFCDRRGTVDRRNDCNIVPSPNPPVSTTVTHKLPVGDWRWRFRNALTLGVISLKVAIDKIM